MFGIYKNKEISVNLLRDRLVYVVGRITQCVIPLLFSRSMWRCNRNALSLSLWLRSVGVWWESCCSDGKVFASLKQCRDLVGVNIRKNIYTGVPQIEMRIPGDTCKYMLGDTSIYNLINNASQIGIRISGELWYDKTILMDIILWLLHVDFRKHFSGIRFLTLFQLGMFLVNGDQHVKLANQTSVLHASEVIPL